MSDEDRSGENPYEGQQGVAIRAEGAGVAIAASQVLAEVQAQVVMARKFPRNPLQAVDSILAECDIREFAEVALYEYSRGGTRIEGPSIRMAEVLARGWGNLMSGIKEISRDNGTSTMMAYAWDLETNRMARREFIVAHVRDKKDGTKTVVKEERDIYEVGANAGSRRERACILALIPGHVVNAAVARVKKTLKESVGDPVERASVMIERFEKEFGVTKLQIERRLRHRIEAVSVAEILALGQVYNSLRDGFAAPEDYFEKEEGPTAKPAATGTAAKAAEAARRAAKPKATSKPAKAPENAATAQESAKAGDSDDIGIPEDI